MSAKEKSLVEELGLEGAEEVQDGDLVKFDKVGVKVVGILKSHDERDGQNGISHIYKVHTPEGTVAFFAPTMLQEKLSNIGMGNIVVIEFTDTKKLSKGTLKLFKVNQVPDTESNRVKIGFKVEESEDATVDEEF